MSKRDAPEYRWNSGPFQIGIVPQGGAISRIDWVRPDGNGTINLLRPVTDQALKSGNPSSLGCFPMVPFANRLAFSQFEFDGRMPFTGLVVDQSGKSNARPSIPCGSITSMTIPTAGLSMSRGRNLKSRRTM